jgi:hypothetical protein
MGTIGSLTGWFAIRGVWPNRFSKRNLVATLQREARCRELLPKFLADLLW